MAGPGATMHARVKQVLTGDSLVLAANARSDGSAPATRTIYLSGITAPRLRRGDDVPFAFASRENLRKLTINKPVAFTVAYIAGSPPREYGTIVLDATNEDLAELQVASGLAKVRDDVRDSESASLSKLKAIESKAKDEKVGLWGADTDGLEVSTTNPPDLQAFVKSNSQPVDSIVEFVRSGDTFRIRLLLSPDKHLIVPISVAGIRCPAPERVTEEETVPQEPCGERAKNFSEDRLLQRNVKTHLHGVTSSGNMLVGSVLHPFGDIAEFLLAEGLARCVDWAAPLVGAQKMASLRAKENEAKQKLLGIWKDHVPRSVKPGNAFEASIGRIVSGDMVELFLDNDTSETVQFASVRQPRTTDDAQKLWQDESREYLRKKLIGKNIRFELNYIRPAQESMPERKVGTITLDGQNVSLDLVEAGLATVIRHRRDDEDRSPAYDDLLIAEKTAQSKKAGVWSQSPPKSSAQRVVDASESQTRARQFIGGLQRMRRNRGVVEYLSSASRLRISIPSQNLRCAVVLGGVTAPRAPSKANEGGEPYGEEALRWVSRQILQRDVEIEVEGVDRTGAFISDVFLPSGKSLALTLIEKGYASISGYGPQASRLDFLESERRAKQAKNGIWKDYVEEDIPINKQDKSSEPATFKPKYIDIIVTEFLPGNSIMVQVINEQLKKLDGLMRDFRSALRLSAEASSQVYRGGDIVAAKFSLDDQYYRGRIRRVDKATSKADVFFIDYGNSEMVPLSDIRSLTESRFSTTAFPSQAQEAVLSFIKMPTKGDVAVEARSYFQHLVSDKQLVAIVDHNENGKLFLSLFDASTGTAVDNSINADLISHGLAAVVGKNKWSWEKGRQDLLTNLLEKQTHAQRERKGMFEYGDVLSDEEN